MTTKGRQFSADDAQGGAARAILRRAGTASLATQLPDPADGPSGWPYASLVLAATDHAGRPLLLLSDLAVHTRALRADNRAALLFDATAGLEDPLTGARVTVLGRIEAIEDDALLARFVAHHPGAAGYAGFDDFHLYRMAPDRAHLVAGFGRISWIDAATLLFDTKGYDALAIAESGIVDHMNADHTDALEDYAVRLLGLEGGAWRMTGIDPEGCDLRCDKRTARLEFEQTVDGPGEARAALVALAKAAR